MAFVLLSLLVASSFLMPFSGCSRRHTHPIVIYTPVPVPASLHRFLPPDFIQKTIDLCFVSYGLLQSCRTSGVICMPGLSVLIDDGFMAMQMQDGVVLFDLCYKLCPPHSSCAYVYVWHVYREAGSNRLRNDARAGVLCFVFRLEEEEEEDTWFSPRCLLRTCGLHCNEDHVPA